MTLTDAHMMALQLQVIKAIPTETDLEEAFQEALYEAILGLMAIAARPPLEEPTLKQCRSLAVHSLAKINESLMKGLIS